MSKSKLFVERLVIYSKGKVVYDQLFNTGVNIIRGWNTTGKSTIIELLVYGLGGEFKDWNEHQSKCDYVVTQIRINSFVLTLKREIDDSGRASMHVLDGTIDGSLESQDSWQVFPSRRSAEKFSFSQKLFEVLGLPQHKTDESKNLTMHQILRLIYVNQLTSTEKLLNDEPSFDNASTRQAIGEYLLGLDDLESHNLRQDLLLANKKFEKANGELQAIFKMFGGDATSINRVALESEIKEANENIKTTLDTIENIKNNHSNNLDEKAKRRLIQLQEEIETKNEQLVSIENERYKINVELVDTKQFLDSLEYRIESLSQSKAIHNELGSIEFKYCPSCFSVLERNHNHAACSLCKSSTQDREKDIAYVQMSNEINFQIAESKKIIEKYEKKSVYLSTEIKSIKKDIDFAKYEYLQLASYSDSKTALISDASIEIGFYKSQVVNLEEKLSLISRVERLIDIKNQYQEDINMIQENLERLDEANKNRRQDVILSIEQIAQDLLRADGGYENQFDNPSEIFFSFSRDNMAVNGRSKFSASSMVVLKNSIRLAMFLHAAEDDFSRFPNLLIMDNIEDKGMVPERSQNFQRTLVNACESLNNEYQVIFSTSMIDENLDNTSLCVGPYYERGSHSLNFN